LGPSSAAANAPDGSGVAASLVATVRSIDAARLPRPVIERTLDLLVDHLGVALRGAREPWSAAVRAQVLAEGASPAATVIGGGRSSARGAAFANGTAAHALEFDDTHDRSLTHPGAPVIAAALAVGEATRAPGADIVAAIVAGYEATGRLGMVLGRALIERGAHPTATLGVFGATAAAGRLHGLDDAKLGHAFGIAASMASGTMAFAQDPQGTMVKRLFGGLPAEHGVVAAELAARGLTGPCGGIDGRYGIAAVLAGTRIDAPLAAAPGGYVVGDMSFKLYACCKNFHALIDAIDACRAPPFDAGAIERIDVYGPQAMIEHHLERRPASTMAAQYSLPFVTAVALLADARSPASFDAAARGRADLLALVDRVVPHHDAECQDAFPAHFAAGVRFSLRDGSTRSARVLDALGTPARPVGREAIVAKFSALTADRLPRPVREEVIDAATSLDSAPDAGRIARALAGAARALQS